MAAPFLVAENDTNDELDQSEQIDSAVAPDETDESSPSVTAPPRKSSVPGDWLIRAKSKNPGVDDDALIAFYERKHAPAPKKLPMLSDWMGRAQKANPDADTGELEDFWQEKYGRFGAKREPEPERDFMRGAETAVKQLPQLAYGLEAGAGALGEKAFGEGGMSTAIKEHGVKKYNEASQGIQKDARPSDSATKAWEMAKQGNPGALVDFLQYGLGYTAVQGVEMLATGGVGYAVGKLGAQGAAKLIAGKLIAKETARLSAGQAVTEAITKQAVANVAGKIGQTTALAATAVGMEGGEIFGDLTSEAQKEGRTLSGEEIAKAFGATVAAGSLEFVGDKIGFDLIMGKGIGRMAGEATGLKGRAARGLIQGTAGAVAEGGTEFGQTLIEEAGKGKDPFSEASIREAVDSAALGAVGGTAIGAGSGALRGAQPGQPTAQPEEAPASTVDDIMASPDVESAIAHASKMVGSASGERVTDPGLSQDPDVARLTRQIERGGVTGPVGSASGPNLGGVEAEPNALNALIERGGGLPTQAELTQAAERTRQPFEAPVLGGPGTQADQSNFPTLPESSAIQPGQAFTPRTEPEADPRAAIQAERNRLIQSGNVPRGTIQEPVEGERPSVQTDSPLQTAAEKAYPAEERNRLPSQDDLLARSKLGAKRPSQAPATLLNSSLTAEAPIQPGSSFTPRQERELTPKERLELERNRLIAQRENGNDKKSLTSLQSVETSSFPVEKQEEAPSKPLRSAFEATLPTVEQIHALAASKGFDANGPTFHEYSKMVVGKSKLDDMSPYELQRLADKLSKVAGNAPNKPVAKPKEKTDALPLPTGPEPIAPKAETSIAPKTAQATESPEVSQAIAPDIAPTEKSESSVRTPVTDKATPIQAEKSKLATNRKFSQKAKESQPDERYRILPQKTRDKFEAAWTGSEQGDRPSIRTLKEWLDPANKTLRGEFERRSGVKLPKGLAATNAAVEAFFKKADVGTSNAPEVTQPIDTAEVARDIATDKSEPFSLASQAESKPKAKGPEQTSIDVPPTQVAGQPIIGREAQPEEAPLFSKAAQEEGPEQTAIPESPTAILADALRQAADKIEGKKALPKADKAMTGLEDSGEKIGGSRKDRWAQRGLTMADLEGMTGGEEAKYIVKSNVWKPNYAEMVKDGTEPKAAALVKVVYDRLAAKPEKDTPEGRRNYLTMMGYVKQAYSSVRTMEDVKNASDTLKYDLVGLPRPNEMRGTTLQDREILQPKFQTFGSVSKGRQDPFYIGYAEGKKANKMVAEGFPNQEPWTRRYDITRIEGRGLTNDGAKFYAARMVELDKSGNVDELAATIKQSGVYEIREKNGRIVSYRLDRASAEAHAQEIYENKSDTKEGGKEPARPHLDELVREGTDYRNGKDVTAEDFRKAFGFRGIEFGNYAASDERQKHVNQAYDALMDLAEVLGIPPKAISLNGTLGLAFGSRGGGKAAAHYEPGKLVINITKVNGPGSLAHELGHALDHYFGELDKPDAYKGKARGASGWYNMGRYGGPSTRLTNLRPEMAQAFDRVMSTLFHRNVTKAEAVRAAELKLEKLKKAVADHTQSNLKDLRESLKMQEEAAGRHLAKLTEEDRPEGGYGKVETSFYKAAQTLSGPTGDYWRRPTEMFARSFEAYVFDRLEGQSDYLVHGVEEDKFTKEKGYKANPYPAGVDRPAINEAFNHLFDTMQSKDTDQGTALFSRQKGQAEFSSHDLSDDEADQFNERAKRAYPGAPTIPGMDAIVADSGENVPEETRAELASRPYMKKIAMALRDATKAFQRALGIENVADFGGFDLYMPNRGVNVPPELTGREVGDPRQIYLNPYLFIERAPIAGKTTPREQAKFVANKLKRYLIHEITHQQVAGHEENFRRQERENYVRLRELHQLLTSKLRSILEATDGERTNVEQLSDDNRTRKVSIKRALAGRSGRHAGVRAERRFDRDQGDDSTDLGQGPDRPGGVLPSRVTDRERVSARGESSPAEPSEVGGRGSYQINPTTARERLDKLPSRHAYVRGLTQSQQDALKHIHGTPQTWGERLNEFKKTWKSELVQGIFDQYHPILNYSKKGYILSRMAKGGDGTLEAMLLYGKPYVDTDGAYRVEYSEADGMKGFSNVLSALQGEHDRFMEWVAAQRADRLKGIGLEHLYRDQDIATLKTLNRGKMPDGTSREGAYLKALKELNSWNDTMMKIGVDSGLMSQESRDLFRDVPYVPFYRLQEEGTVQGFGMKPGLVNQYAWKKLKGGTEHLNDDLLANLLQNWSHIITASAKNRAAKETLNAAINAGVAEEVSNSTPGKDLVHYLDGGKTVTVSVSDPALMDAVASLHYAGLGAVGKPFVAMKRVLSFAVTVNPAYKIRNLIRDSIQAIGTSELSYNPIKNIAQGVKGTSIQSETRAQMLAGGGMMRFGSMLDGNNADRTRRLIDKGVDPSLILNDAGAIEAFWKKRIVPAFDAYQELGDRGEQVNRVALYKQLMAKGMTHQEATFWARDLMDFSMSGKWAAVRIITQVVPFMNARLQGLYKLGRAGATDYRKMATTLGAVALASIGLMLAYGDDEDWKKREDWDRENYWWFKIGDMAVRIPKPFEIGAIGTIAERSVEYLTSKEMTGKRFGERMVATVMNQLSMNPTPQLVKPMMDLYANKDSFSGRPIETMGMERLRKADRMTERTSEAARFLGGLGLPDPAQLAMGRWDTLSPVQVDSLVRGYFSWLGSTTTTVLDYGIRPFVDRGERPNMQLRNVFLAGNFVETLPTGSSRYLSELYSQAAEIEQAYASYRDALKRGDREGALEIRSQERDKIALYPMIEKVKRRESAINERIKMVEQSRSLSGEEKRSQIDRLREQKHELAKRVSDRMLAVR